MYFESLEEKVPGEGSPGSTDASEEKKFEPEAAKQIVGDVEAVPLNDSITYEEVADSQHEDGAEQKGDFMSQAALALVENGQASKVMADLENLLETGYAELIQSEQESQDADEEAQESGH